MKTFFFFLAATAVNLVAQHGGGGHAASNSGQVRATSAASARPAQTAVQHPAATTSSASTIAPVHANASGAAIANPRVVIAERTVLVTNYRPSFYWGGGYYFGAWYGPGYYYALGMYPGAWYWNGWAGYQYGFSPYATMAGIKFDLEAIPESDRKAVQLAAIYIPDAEGKRGYIGSVKEFVGKLSRALPLKPGLHDVAIVLVDGREIDMSITVTPQRITHVLLRLDKPADAEQVPAKRLTSTTD